MGKTMYAKHVHCIRKGANEFRAIFYGVSPAVIALILHSCYRLAKLGMEDWLQLGDRRRLFCGHGRGPGGSRRSRAS